MRDRAPQPLAAAPMHSAACANDMRAPTPAPPRPARKAVAVSDDSALSAPLQSGDGGCRGEQQLCRRRDTLRRAEVQQCAARKRRCAARASPQRRATEISVSGKRERQMIALKVAGESIRTVLPRIADHTATTAVVWLWLSGTAATTVVGMRPGFGGCGSL